MAKQRLMGQRALVTGASSGIGKELARRLAREGANLVLTARRKERLEELARELESAHGVKVAVEALDLMAPDAARRLYERTEGQGLAIDLLINNAGFGDYDDFLAAPWERYAGMIQVNVTALTELCRLFLPRMVERSAGYVMNVASMGAYIPTPHFAVYTATKAYVRNFTEALDYELKGTGVRAISVCPGGTKTEFLDAANQKLKSSGEAAMMTAERCADIAVRAMLRGRRNIVTGFLNALSVFLMRFLPRCWLPGIAAVSMSTAVEKGDRSALPASPAPAALPAPAAEQVAEVKAEGESSGAGA